MRPLRWFTVAVVVTFLLALALVAVSAARATGATCPQMITHQGKGGPHPANTLAALRWAADAGIPRFESDTFYTSDAVPMIAHQDKVGQDYISQLTYAQMRDRHPERPTFGQMVRTAKAEGIRLLVELKRPYGAPGGPGWAPIHDRIADADMRLRVILWSQRRGILADYHADYPGQRLGWKAPADATPAEAYDWLDLVSRPPSVAGSIRDFEQAGRLMVSRTQTRDEWRRLGRWGYHALLTNNPDARSCP